MPWKSLNMWLYDGIKQSEIPPILLKSGSPVTHQTLIKMFINNGPLNHYLNKYLNSKWVFSIQKDELLRFIKQCIIDYKIRKNSSFHSRRPTKDKLIEVLREKIPTLKNNDLALLSDIITKSEDRDTIFETLGLKSPSTKKIKKIKKSKKTKISQKEYISENFNYIEV